MDKSNIDEAENEANILRGELYYAFILSLSGSNVITTAGGSTKQEKLHDESLFNYGESEVLSYPT